MTESPRNTWDILAKKPPSGDRLTSKEVYTGLTDRLSSAVGANGQRHLLILLNMEDEELTDKRSQGLSVMTRNLQVADADPKKYIDIACEDPGGHPAFDLLAEDIANALGDKALSPSVATSRVLAKWRRFWSRLTGLHLGRAEQIGLFAELWFLLEWLIPNEGAGAVSSWKGPFGYKNDFENDLYCVEVKATTSRRGRIFHVNGVDQLENPENSVLYFFGVCLIETESQGKSIPTLVTEIREKLADQYKALGHLDERLIRAGYSDIHAETYEWMKFRIREVRLFEVKEDFPKLDEISTRVPPGVERIEYEINLNNFDHLIVAGDPLEWNL